MRSAAIYSLAQRVLVFLCFGMFSSLKVVNRSVFIRSPLQLCNPNMNTLHFSSTILATSSTSFDDNSLNEANKAKAIFILGGPGSGKGTQSEMLASEFGISHLSAGELLRKEIGTGSEQGQIIDAILKEGRIVPVEMSLSLLRKEIQQQGQSRYIIDGFPRNYDNIDGWQRMMPNVCDIEMVLFLDCQEQEMERRILERGLTSNRADDNLVTARKRFVTFQQDSMPVIDYFATNMKDNLIIINGDRSIQTVYADVKMKFESLIKDELIQINRMLLKDAPSDADCIISDENATVHGTYGEYTCRLSRATQSSDIVKKEWKMMRGKWTLSG